MRPYAILSFLMLVSISATGQIRMWQHSLKDSSLHIAYIGAPNEIAIDNLPPGAIVKTSGGEILEKQYGYYLWMPFLVNPDTLFIIKQGKVLLAQGFQVYHIKDPYAALCGIKKSRRSVAHILACPTVNAVIDSCYLKMRYAVMSFDMQFFSKQVNNVSDFGARGSRLTEEQLSYVRRLKPGDKILFKNIKAVRPDARTRSLNDFTITIE